MIEDLVTFYRRDPALHGVRAAELVLYQGLWAIWGHRLAHRLHRRGIPFLPRLVSQLVRLLTGIEIHPGAQIGRRCFIDHGSGVIIGETAEIGADVTIYQGVTLGGRGWWTDRKGSKRHPTVGDGVLLAAGATVLGPVHIGAGSRIGPHAVVLADVPPHATVNAAPAAVRAPARPLEYEI